MTQTRNQPSSCKLAEITWSATFLETEKTKASRWKRRMSFLLFGSPWSRCHLSTLFRCTIKERNIICVEKAWDASIIQIFSQRVSISHHFAFKVFPRSKTEKRDFHFRRINFRRKNTNNCNFLVENSKLENFENNYNLLSLRFATGSFTNLEWLNLMNGKRDFQEVLLSRES